VVGVAVGFGAQSLVKDFFSGFFILLENQVRVGDVVTVGGRGGLVEEVTLRYVRLRDYDGNVHFVPNGTIDVVTNSTLDFAYAVVDVGVAYREDVDDALGIMRRVAEDLRKDALFGLKIQQEVEVVGVERWADSAVILRVRFKVLPIEQWNVRREYLKRLKHAFDEAGIEIPYPHLTLYPGRSKDGSAPPLVVAPAAPLHVVNEADARTTPASA
jgi:small conductance mechanosensitive channel